MTPIVLRATGLTAVYLLVLSSLAPGDVVIGGLLGLAVAFALRSRDRHGSGQRAAASPATRLRAAGVVLLQTAAEITRGSWRTARFCLGAATEPGLLEIPRAGRSPVNVAMWGVLTGLSPDEVVVHVDEARDVLLVHLVDATNPAAVRERHAHSQDWQRRVVP
ncbi:MAG: Na+/H+ antiporter subunit E [Thermoleophilaceae bacterium]